MPCSDHSCKYRVNGYVPNDISHNNLVGPADRWGSSRPIGGGPQRGKASAGRHACQCQALSQVPSGASSLIRCLATTNIRHFYTLQEKQSDYELLRSSPKSIAMSRRAIYAVAIPVVGAGGYYLYSAGGDTKVAQKKAERIYSLSDLWMNGV